MCRKLKDTQGHLIDVFKDRNTSVIYPSSLNETNFFTIIPFAFYPTPQGNQSIISVSKDFHYF